MAFQITYVATPSTASPTDTFYTLNQLTPDSSSADIATLSTDNYPADRIPLKDINGYDLPNPANQNIFKNQPVSWWIDQINAGNIKYTPVSNTVNWAFVDSDSNAIHMNVSISSYMIPNRTGNVDRDQTTQITKITLQDNGVLNLTQTYPGR